MALTSSTQNFYKAATYISTTVGLTAGITGVATGNTDLQTTYFFSGGLALAGVSMVVSKLHDELSQKLISWQIGKLTKEAVEMNDSESVWKMSQKLFDAENKIDNRLEAADDPKTKQAIGAMGVWVFAAQLCIQKSKLMDMPYGWDDVQSKIESRIDAYNRLLTNNKPLTIGETENIKLGVG